MDISVRRYLALIFTVLLGIHRGFVALWLPEETSPAVIFPYSAASLPAHDREALEEGIVIESREQLTQLLEDYLS